MKEKSNYKKWLGLLVSTAILMAMTVSPGYTDPNRHQLGDFKLPPAVYKKLLKLQPMDMALDIPLPGSYDARDYGFVTPPKDQGSCGSCWAFATVGAFESHLLKQYGVDRLEDLSEQQQVSCNTAMWGCSGGTSTAIQYYNEENGQGPVDESYFPYTGSDSTDCIEEAAEQLGYRVFDYHTVPQTTEGFKNSLVINGPSYWRYNVYDDFYDYWYSNNPDAVYINYDNRYVGGHAVLLIGWDDSKGAFLCKNSWGGGGPNGDGTFWIAYDGHAHNLGFAMANFSLTSTGCETDQECDDGIYCNGVEICVSGTCQEGTPVSCEQNGSFCDGTEVCNEANGGCGSSGDPCASNEICNEVNDRCDPLCGNGYCGDPGEDCFTCPSDCDSGTVGDGDVSECFKHVADGKCNLSKDGPTCPDCLASYCCGDGICESGETYDVCAIDCQPSVCGNKICETDENTTSCPADCPAVTCNGFKEECSDNSDCCSNRCNKGICR
ncbi:C1 family peptidase [Desulforhopalus singaporensis]|uniref:Papain family cysteine protease n=1 Tax=Desulforhopalus singaporensis TaxID=91360 RepID=A0A1H0NU28_9BACT|nr:C1 family peptidase [Desulforhopalus singaporensis]SDO96201.1 Papain family cysteine protease [Desulforhopalus singaporensis]